MNNKVAVKDGIGAKLIKTGPERLTVCLHRLIVRICETEQIPEEWMQSVICKLESENYDNYNATAGQLRSTRSVGRILSSESGGTESD